MLKFAIPVMVFALLSGCVPQRQIVQEDNSPDVRERENYYERCIGQSTHSRDPVPDELRIACVRAVMGKGD